MEFFSRLGQLAFLIPIVSAALTTPLSEARSETPRLIIDVADTTVYPGENIALPIYLSNYQDTVAGFDLWLLLDRPDIAAFQTDTVAVTDTTYWECLEYSGPDCIDSQLTDPWGDWDFFHVDTSWTVVGNHDTTGTLLAGWEYVASRSLSGMGFDLKIAALANLPEPPLTPGIPPQSDGLLFKVMVDVFEIPDTMSDRTVTILPSSDCFATPDAQCIGLVYDTVLDTTCFVCTEWSDTICLNWKISSIPPCDSIAIGWDTIPYIDTTAVILLPGSITVLPPGTCGDLNCDGNTNVADLTCFVGYLFLSDCEPCLLHLADIDGIDGINVADLTYLVAYLFQGGPAPVCD